MRLGIIEHVDCAHFLPGHERCGVLHGHTYKIELIVEGEVEGGMVIDFAHLKRALREVLNTYDHRSWNDVLEYPSVENICLLLMEEIRQKIQFPFTLRVWEGEGKWAELSSKER